MRRATVRITRNFERNVQALRQFAAENLEEGAFDAVLDDVFARVIPNLERFPDIGRDFRTRAPQSVEGLALLERLNALVGEDTSVREYFAAPCVILYAHRGTKVHLLSIKHGRQLSFDLGGHWS